MNAHHSFPSCVDAALEYAARGWAVFPVPPGTKKSHKSAEHSGGRRWGATTDRDEIARDWSRWPDANIGIACGPVSGLLVIEADTAEGHGVDGIGNLRALIEAHGPLPDTIEAVSPSGSWHLYFRWPEGQTIGNSASQIAPGIDVRGDGGMVVTVPSVKPGKGCYRWQNPPPLFDLADCPDWLVQLCLKPKTAKGEGFTFDTGTDASRWAEAALAAEIAALMTAPKGKRNEMVNSCGFSLGQIVGGGYLDRARIEAAIWAAAVANGVAIEEPDQTRASMASGIEAGMREPRGPKDEPRSQGGTAATADGQHRPNGDDAFDLSHDALALALEQAPGWGRDAKHVSAWASWLFWDGTRWLRDDRLDHMTRTRAFLRDRAEAVTAWAERKAEDLEDREADKLRGWAKGEARTLRNKTTVAAVEALARSNPAMVAGADDFDRDTLLLGTPGGTVDLRSGTIRPARREDLITKQTTVAPAPGKPALWLRFLSEIFDGDAAMIAFMQRAAGYALTGETREHKLLFCYGGGRNGKSTFLDTLADLMGDYAKRAPATAFLKTQGEKHSTDIAGLRGARLVVGSELPKGKVWDEAVIKDLTGGGKMSARLMRQNNEEFQPQLTLFIAGNNMPSFHGVDEAIRARVVLVPFTVTIPPERRDQRLGEKLRAEAGQVLSWAIEGAAEWQRRGLDVPASVAAASRDYFDDEDLIGQFLADHTISEAGAFVTTTALYERFIVWASQQGLNSWTQNTLRKEIRARGWKDGRRDYGRGFLGMRLRA